MIHSFTGVIPGGSCLVSPLSLIAAILYPLVVQGFNDGVSFLDVGSSKIVLCTCNIFNCSCSTTAYTLPYFPRCLHVVLRRIAPYPGRMHSRNHGMITSH